MTGYRKIICGMSGGVDSAVSALLLKKNGFNVVGAFMRNWDMVDETGHCSSDADYEDAQFVCRHLGIDLHKVDFVKEYWNNVFTPMLATYEQGHTPNPDVLCNRHVKFGAFFDYATSVLGGDAVATGHYARNSAGQFLERHDPTKGCSLLSGVDPVKDQTLFLCQIKQRALQRTMFPVGGLMKSQVKKMAVEAGMGRIANKKESMGICFIGSRNFHNFMEEYLEPKPGNFVILDTGEIVGKHRGVHYWTVGQRAMLGGRRKACFVIRMDPSTREVFVVEGTDHPALYTSSLHTQPPHWINAPPAELTETGRLACRFRFQHIHPLIDCFVERCHDSRAGLAVTLARPLRAVTPGQYAVFYHGDVCLGSAMIAHSGPSMYELNHLDRIPLDKEFL